MGDRARGHGVPGRDAEHDLLRDARAANAREEGLHDAAVPLRGDGSRLPSARRIGGEFLVRRDPQELPANARAAVAREPDGRFEPPRTEERVPSRGCRQSDRDASRVRRLRNRRRWVPRVDRRRRQRRRCRHRCYARRDRSSEARRGGCGDYRREGRSHGGSVERFRRRRERRCGASTRVCQRTAARYSAPRRSAPRRLRERGTDGRRLRRGELRVRRPEPQPR